MKIFCLRYLSLSYLLLFSFLSPTHANNGIGLGPIANNGGGNLGFVLDAQCNLEVDIFVYLTYLELFPPNTNGSSTFYFPNAHPPLYVAFTIGNAPTQMILLDEFIWDGNFNGTDYYYSDALSNPVNFSSECGLANLSGEILVDIDMKLMTLGKNNFVPYPACDYTQGQDVFSCDGPWTESANCDPFGTCDNESLTEALYTVTVFCENCQGEGDVGLLGGPTTTNQLSVSTPINVTPNPFTDRLMVNCDYEDPIQKVELYDLSGKKLHQQLFEEDETPEVEVNVLGIPSGLYLVKVQTKKSIETFKMFKAN